ncbi:hypothetical protein BH24DEI2_BH24DEI2_01830 [soil metagenome]
MLEAKFEELRAGADVTFPEDSIYQLEDATVATVGDEEVKRSELNQAVYLSPQIQQSLSPQTAELVTTLFKPSVLEQLINRDLAYQGAAALDAQFIGSKGQVAQQALAYVSRDATASDEELQKYYDANQDRFTVPTSAVTTRADFDTEAAATDFRTALLAGTALQEAADASVGTVQDLGTVRQGSLQPDLDSALFSTDAFTDLPDSPEAISDILVLSEPVAPDLAGAETGGAETGGAETGGAETGGDGGVTTEEAATRDVYVVLVAERTSARVRPLTEVRAQVENAVLEGKRADLQETWLTGLREKIGVENLLAAANPADAFTTTPLNTGAETGGAPILEDAPATNGATDSATDGVTEDAADGSEADSVDSVPADAAEDATPAEETTPITNP